MSAWRLLRDPGLEFGGRAEWAEQVLDRRATLVRQLRRRFDGLRPAACASGGSPTVLTSISPRT